MDAQTWGCLRRVALDPGGSRLALAQVGHGLAHSRAGIVGLEHGGVSGFPEDLAHEPLHSGEAELHHDGAIASLLDHAPRLARPAGTLRRHPHARAARGLHLARAQPAVDLGGRVHLGSRAELLLRDGRALDAVESEVAYAVALR